MKLKWVLHVVIWKTGEVGSSPHSPFPSEGTLLNWEVPPWHWAVPPWGMWWCRQNETVLLFLCVELFSGFLLHCVCCWNFLSRLLSSSRAIFVCGYLSNCWYLWGDRGWISHPIFWWHHFLIMIFKQFYNKILFELTLSVLSLYKKGKWQLFLKTSF